MQISKVILRSIFLLLVTIYVTLAVQETSPKNQVQDPPPLVRDKRLFFKKKSRPGFIPTLFSVIYEQWVDSKNTINKVKDLVNDNFAPENGQIVATTTKNNDPNATTTEAPTKITRSELYKILRRNVKGLVRLFNIELKDALKISEGSKATFRKNASVEVSKYL